MAAIPYFPVARHPTSPAPCPCAPRSSRQTVSIDNGIGFTDRNDATVGIFLPTGNEEEVAFVRRGTHRAAMVKGHLDALAASGFILGWAAETTAPARPIAVRVRMDERHVAEGIACEFRPDVAAAGIGCGWCGFTLRLGIPALRARKARLALVHADSGKVLHEVDSLPLHADAAIPIANVHALLAADPTVIASIEQLSACEPLFLAYIKNRGSETFVRTAYAYVLQRRADETGLAIYARALRQAALSSLEILRTLADSDEFRSRPRLLAAPTSASFPFRSA